MKIFLFAALPWVIIGIAVAVIAAYYGKKKKAKSPEDPEKAAPADAKKSDDHENYMSIGMCLGMCAGMLFGTTGVVPLSYGISFGMLIGMVVGMCIPKK